MGGFGTIHILNRADLWIGHVYTVIAWAALAIPVLVPVMHAGAGEVSVYVDPAHSGKKESALFLFKMNL